YLEARGIGADKQWATYLEAFLKTASLAADSRARHDIIWRSRASRTSALLAEIIRDPKTMVPELPRYFRAFDFQKDSEKETVLLELVRGKQAGETARKNMILIEAVKRLKNLTGARQAEVAVILERTLQGV